MNFLIDPDLFINPDVAIVLTGLLVGTASSLLGTFLVLRKSSMLVDAVSHSILLGIILVFLVTKNQYSPFFILGAAAAGLLTVALTELLASSKRVKDDAIGLVYPLLFAVAVLLGEIGFVWIDTTSLFGVSVPNSLLTMGLVTLLNLAFVTFFIRNSSSAPSTPAWRRRSVQPYPRLLPAAVFDERDCGNGLRRSWLGAARRLCGRAARGRLSAD